MDLPQKEEFAKWIFHNLSPENNAHHLVLLKLIKISIYFNILVSMSFSILTYCLIKCL